MFNTLETSWDRSARRGWSALASFTFQAMALSLLLVIPMFIVQGPPRLQWLQTITAPLAPAAPAPPLPRPQAPSTSNYVGRVLQEPTAIPPITAHITDDGPITPPDLSPGVPGATGTSPGAGISDSIGTATPLVTVTPAAPAHRLIVSHWDEGNLIYRVQPVYPAIARQAHVQGSVQLRAVISKTGTIERLTLQSGHPMLAASALSAVRQWRYRPYLLNDEPIEIETEITVNFVLASN